MHEGHSDLMFLPDGLAAVGVTVFAEELALRAKFDANLASLTSAHLRLMDDVRAIACISAWSIQIVFTWLAAARTPCGFPGS